MKRDHNLFLVDILDAIVAIEKFEGMDYEKFVGDDKTSSAVIRKFEILGATSKSIPTSIRQKYPQIPWKRMAWMRK